MLCVVLSYESAQLHHGELKNVSMLKRLENFGVGELEEQDASFLPWGLPAGSVDDWYLDFDLSPVSDDAERRCGTNASVRDEPIQL
jgi:hypothetical protein